MGFPNIIHSFVVIHGLFDIRQNAVEITINLHTCHASVDVRGRVFKFSLS